MKSPSTAHGVEAALAFLPSALVLVCQGPGLSWYRSRTG